MTKEIYHEGWLIKSPPTKRIWRARWRRRWFTLKQGEIPEQFCLEYYTDRNCRKLKGVIDLDQCEQVDSGLRLEHRKQKFQHMFDVKTPRRTYYLAADSEDDMNDWVNCICQVCNLQDLSKQQHSNNDSRHYYNISLDKSNSQLSHSLPPASTLATNLSTIPKQSVSLPSTELGKTASARNGNQSLDNNNSIYQNFDAENRNSAYNNRETIICDGPLEKQVTNVQQQSKNLKEDYYNFCVVANEAKKVQTFERSHSTRSVCNSDANGSNAESNSFPISHGRTQSLIVQKTNSTSARKIPENLNLKENIFTDCEPSPALSTSSGPYIAISECISGNPLIDRDNPMTPLNSLDPKFYDTPRSHINIGLNLTNEQPYSPKRNNYPTTQPRPSCSGRSSPTDSESVFTDDEEWIPTNTAEKRSDRSLRPSDSSVENDSIVFTYAQRFSRVPSKKAGKSQNKKTKKHADGNLVEEADNDEQNREGNSSDTENASPAIAYGPKDMSSCVDENYDIPRSHHLPYYSLNNNNLDNIDSSLSPIIEPTIASTPKLDENNETGQPLASANQRSATLQKSRPHFYTNAAPTKVEGNVFRYDFDEQQSDAPVVNRKLKPRLHAEEKEEKVITPNKPLRPASTPAPSIKPLELRPPCIDRKLKPITPNKFETNSLHRRGDAANLSFSAFTEAELEKSFCSEKYSQTLPKNYNNSLSLSAQNFSAQNFPTTTNCSKQIHKLEYFDLDHSNPPPICKNTNTSASTSNLASHIDQSSVQNITKRHTISKTQPDVIAGSSTNANAVVASTGIVYKSVDFIKTQAFMRTRQDAELNRAKNRLKD